MFLFFCFLFFFVVHFNLCYWLLLCYFKWRSSAGCMYSEKSGICDILPELSCIFKSLTWERGHFSLCLRHAYCTVGSNGNVKKQTNKQTKKPRSNLPTHFKPVLPQSCLTLKRFLPEAGLKPGRLWKAQSVFGNTSFPGLSKTLRYSDTLRRSHIVHKVFFSNSAWARTTCLTSAGKRWRLQMLSGRTRNIFICCCCMLSNDATWRNHEAVLNMLN